MIRAVISLGTNTTRLLVVRERGDGPLEQLEHRQTGTRLGEGLRDAGSLLPAAMERTLAAVREFVAVARGYDATLYSIATSAVRRATNAAGFAAEMRALTGVELHVLDGQAEAEASFRGATYGSVPNARIAVVDVGGGSTECALGRNSVEMVRSVEIGSVRVAERFVDLTGAAPGARARAAALAARGFIAEALAPLRALPRPEAVTCVAGTALTLAAVLRGSHVDRVSGTPLGRAALDATLERLLDLDLAQRRALPGMLPQRADILPAGGLVLSETLRALDADSAVCEANDLLLGFLLQQNAPSRPAE